MFCNHQDANVLWTRTSKSGNLVWSEPATIINWLDWNTDSDRHNLTVRVKKQFFVLIPPIRFRYSQKKILTIIFSNARCTPVAVGLAMEKLAFVFEIPLNSTAKDMKSLGCNLNSFVFDTR